MLSRRKSDVPIFRSFRFSTEVSDLLQKIQIFRGKSESSAELFDFPQNSLQLLRNFWIFDGRFGFSIEVSDFPQNFFMFDGNFDFSAELFDFLKNFSILYGSLGFPVEVPKSSEIRFFIGTGKPQKKGHPNGELTWRAQAGLSRDDTSSR